MKMNLLSVALLLAGQLFVRAADAPTAQQQVVHVRADDSAITVAMGWAETFGSSHPGQRVQIGGGNASPILGIARDSRTLGILARPNWPSELKRCVESFGEPPRESIVALTASAVYVHLDNPVRELTLAQLREIFSGGATNWQTFGGSNAPIHLYARQLQASNTYRALFGSWCLVFLWILDLDVRIFYGSTFTAVPTVTNCSKYSAFQFARRKQPCDSVRPTSSGFGVP